MHGHDPKLLEHIANFLGPYYLILAIMNGVAALWLWQRAGRWGQGIVWAVAAVVYTVLSSITWSGITWDGALFGIPSRLQEIVNSILTGNQGAIIYTVGTASMLVILFLGRRFFVQPMVAWSMLNLALLLMGLSMVSLPFWSIVSKADNVPIVALVYLLGFFTWLAAYKAVQNDDRAKEGLPPLEKGDDEKVLVWPDLVYTELICMVVVTVILIVWSIGLEAPLEDAANAVKTPNPSKAPWYFLGLQEMLVYYDPWMAGVVLPTFIIIGLIAIPYIDFNKQGNGYYTIDQRPFAYVVFLGGFSTWVILIILGTFLRGPNWNFFSPFEQWDPHKVLALNNVNLSEWLWVDILGSSIPKVSSEMSGMQQFVVILSREWLGMALVLGYFILLPPLLAVSVLKKFFLRMGFIRYMVLANLLLFMAALPIKMALRWVFNLKYIVAIPEIFFNL